MTASFSEAFARLRLWAWRADFGWTDVFLLLFYAEIAWAGVACYHFMTAVEELLHHHTLYPVVLLVLMTGLPWLLGVGFLIYSWRQSWRWRQTERYSVR